jgi:hypothetical protein
MITAAVVATPANAIPVLWTLSGVTLTDGTTLTGSFVYDADVPGYSDIDITSSGGSKTPSMTWTIDDPNATVVAVQLDLVDGTTNLTGTPTIELSFNVLKDAGGIDLIRPSTTFYGTCGSSVCISFNSQGVTGVGGELIGVPVQTSVPEPSSLTLLLAGLAAAGLLHTAVGRRRTTAGQT